MCDIHALYILPSQTAINSVATYRVKLNQEDLDYRQLLNEMKYTFDEHDFMCAHDNSQWMQCRGYDYLYNPKLFYRAPLTYICAFLSEIFKAHDLSELQEKLTPDILSCILTRLEEFI